MDRNGGPGEDVVDAAIIGGSFAGLAAALYLARGRRRVVVFDHGRTRNRYAAHAHGFLGQDGRAPESIRMAGRADVLAYPTVTLREARVAQVDGAADDFRLTAEDGSEVRARRLILAHGMRDILPDIAGLAECWGVTAVQCPYCHGYEMADRPTGILMTGPGALHQARILRDWSSDRVLLANGHALSEADQGDLEQAGVQIEEAPVSAFLHDRGEVRAARLADGREVPMRAVYLVPQAELSAPFATELGCALKEGPMGLYLQVDGMQATTVAGVFAAGDITRPMYGATLAAADGMMAGTACHRSLMGL